MPTSRPDPDLSNLRPDLLRAAQAWTGRPERAQDLTQDILLQLWRQRLRGETIRDPRAYALCALHDACRRSLRRQWRRVELTEDMLVTQPDVFLRLTLEEVRVAMTRLPDAQARLLHLVAEGETSPAVLAKRLDLPVGTVMSRLARARAQLRRDLRIDKATGIAALL